ncbi:hypothetical protein IIB51_00345 [Patescibacteria group bacterium]|nr:hypothetical protein [Patescibacteria group bacterium]
MKGVGAKVSVENVWKNGKDLSKEAFFVSDFLKKSASNRERQELNGRGV